MKQEELNGSQSSRVKDNDQLRLQREAEPKVSLELVTWK